MEVSDEIVEAILLDKRAERPPESARCTARLGVPVDDGIENAAIGWAQPSPEDYLRAEKKSRPNTTNRCGD